MADSFFLDARGRINRRPAAPYLPTSLAQTGVEAINITEQERAAIMALPQTDPLRIALVKADEASQAVGGGGGGLGSSVIAPSPMPAFQIDVMDLRNTKTISQPSEFSFDGTPEDGRIWGATITNSTAEFQLCKIPACLSEAQQKTITSFYLPPKAKLKLMFSQEDGITHIVGEPDSPRILPTSQRDYTTVMAIFPGWNPLNGGGPFAQDENKNPTDVWRVIPPNRMPLIGVADDSDQAAVDWQLETMRDYGIDVACIEFYFIGDGNGGIRPDLISFLDCYMKSTVRDKPKFMIMWIVDTNAEIYSLANWPTVYRTFFPYFRDEHYFRIDGKPALMVFQASKFYDRMGGSNANVITALQTIRAEMAAEFGGVHLSVINPASDDGWLNLLPTQGWDAVTAYTVFEKFKVGDTTKMLYPPNSGWDRFLDAVYGPNQNGTETGQTGSVFHSWLGNSGYPEPAAFPAPALTSNGWLGSSMPEVWPPTPAGWSPQPWSPASTSFGIPTNAEFLDACRRSRAVVDAYRATKTKNGIVFFVAWNELGEGQIIMPTAGQGYGKVEQIRATFGNRYRGLR